MANCCRVVHSHGMLRFGTRGLMPLGAVGVLGCVSSIDTTTWHNTEVTGMMVCSVGGRSMISLILCDKDRKSREMYLSFSGKESACSSLGWDGWCV